MTEIVVSEFDKRMTLCPGDYIVGKDENGIEVEQYQIESVLAKGGFSITYIVLPRKNCTDNSLKDKSSIRYVLKEFYPKQLCDRIQRNGDGSLCVDKICKDVFDTTRRLFENEYKFQNTIFPPSNSKEGIHFFYPETIFTANNTSYILFQTEYGNTLADEFLNIKEVNPERIIEILRDVSSAISVIHGKFALHLDISDTNIFVCKGRTKLLDFGNAIILNNQGKAGCCDEIISCTKEFAPIEILEAAEYGINKAQITASSDTYSICAILFKYIVGETFNPGLHLNNQEEWINAIKHKKSLKKYGNAIKKRLIEILKKGLGAQCERYASGQELYIELDSLKKEMHSSKINKRINRIRFAEIASAFCLVFVIATVIYINTPAPNATVIVPIDTVYEESENIEFSVKVTDSNIKAGMYSPLDMKKALIMEGFDADVSVEVRHEDNNTMIVEYSLNNIISDAEGVKTIKIGKLYDKYAGLVKKSHKEIKQSFLYLSNNIDIIIDEPSFTKINTPFREISFDVSIMSPDSFEFDATQIIAHGFDYSETEIKRVGIFERDNVVIGEEYTVTYKNISGECGECYIEFPYSCCFDNNGRKSKDTFSPIFNIVSEKTNSQNIEISLFSTGQNLCDGGFIILKYDVYGSTDYSGIVDESNVFLNGFDGDVQIYNNSIVVSNIHLINEKSEMYVSLASDILTSKENGSKNHAVVYYINRQAITDTTPPSVLAKSKVERDSAMYIIASSDLYSEVYYADNLYDYIVPENFTYEDMKIEPINNRIYVFFRGVKCSDEKIGLWVKSGIAKDSSGNISAEIHSHSSFKH